MIRSLAVASLTALMLVACSAKPALIRIADIPPQGTVFKGLPLRMKTEQVVQVWQLDLEKRTYKQVTEARQTLADQTRLYAMDVKSGPFASPTLRVTQYADNTLKTVQVASSTNVAGVLDAGTTVASGISTARNSAASGATTDYNACQAARAAANVALGQVSTAQNALNTVADTEINADLRAAYKRAIKEAQEAADFALDNPQCG